MSTQDKAGLRLSSGAFGTTLGGLQDLRGSRRQLQDRPTTRTLLISPQSRGVLESLEMSRTHESRIRYRFHKP